MNEYEAPPLSRATIRKLAHEFRTALGIKDKAYVDVVKILENIMPILFEDFSYEYIDDERLGAMALTVPSKKCILIKESVYIGAVMGVPRDRFTIMHEIAHYVLHRGIEIRLARDGQKVEPFRDPEWQADAFAGEFLMDCDIVGEMLPEEISRTCGVSMSAAEYQYKQYQKTKKR